MEGLMIKVGMSDVKICVSPNAVTTLGLGSCIGVAIRDPLTKIGGLVHIMLPDSTQIKNNENKAKFADTGIEELVRLIMREGGNRGRMVAKIAGGSQMFAFNNKGSLMRVGERNAIACKEKLVKMRIPLLAEDTGQNYGRTVAFYPETGDYLIRTVGKPETKI